jgi:hypothetical protein
MTTFHHTAAALIVAAAAKSGLLKEVAEVLRFIDTESLDPALIDKLREEFADAFDDHICLAGCVLENFFNMEGLNTPPYTDAELEPYLGVNPSQR